jgi:hypothetical protein
VVFAKSREGLPKKIEKLYGPNPEEEEGAPGLARSQRVKKE